MSKSLTILVDVDNVLEDLHTPWVAAVNKKYGTDVKPEDITSWNIEKFFDGLSRNQVFSPLHTAELWESLEPLEGSQKYLKMLIKDGHKVFLLTSAHPDTIPLKFKFLQKYFSFIPFRDVIISSHKQMVIGNVLIDDAPHNLVGGDYEKILVSAPYNRNFDTKGNWMYRADNWEEIYSIIQEISNK